MALARRRPNRRARPRSPGSWEFMTLRRNAIFTGGFLVLSLLLLILVGKLIAPFASALLWSAVLTLVVYPVYLWIYRLSGRRRNMAAIITTALIALGVLGPTTFLATVLTRESADAYESMREALQGGKIKETMSRLSRAPAELLPGLLEEESIRQLEERIENLGTSLLSNVAGAVSRVFNHMLSNAAKFLMDLFVALVAIFYFLREGALWVQRLKKAVPLSPKVWELVADEFSSTFTAVVHGMLLSAAILGLLLGIGFKLFGVPLPAFLGMITFFLAPMPFIGPITAWAPACLYLIGIDEPNRAIGLFIYGGVIIFTVDNLLRPMLIGSISRMPALFMFIAIMGGIYAFGPLGVFLGPVLLAIAMAVGGIYQQITQSSPA